MLKSAPVSSHQQTTIIVTSFGLNFSLYTSMDFVQEEVVQSSDVDTNRSSNGYSDVTNISEDILLHGIMGDIGNLQGSSSDDDDDDETVAKVLKKLSGKKRKVGRTSQWRDELVDDMVDIIVNDESYKKSRILTNTKNCKNSALYEKIIAEIKERPKIYIQCQADEGEVQTMHKIMQRCCVENSK